MNLKPITPDNNRALFRVRCGQPGPHGRCWHDATHADMDAVPYSLEAYFCAEHANTLEARGFVHIGNYATLPEAEEHAAPLRAKARGTIIYGPQTDGEVYVLWATKETHEQPA